MGLEYSYKIITTYFIIEEKYGYSIQLNLISWNNKEPKYDLRRWHDGKPLKGMALDEGTLKAICKEISKIGSTLSVDEDTRPAGIENYSGKNTQREEKQRLKEMVLEILGHPDYIESQLHIDEVIDEQAVINYLLRNGISTLSDLTTCIRDDTIYSLKGFTTNKEIKIYDAIIRFDEKAPSDILGDDRCMFTEICTKYMDLPVSVIAPFLDTKESKKVAGQLLAGGYNTIGKLNGVLESELERIVGRKKAYIFTEAERVLALEPEQIIAEMWEKKSDSRAVTIILERSKGCSYKEIADEVGLSRERIRQMILAFYAGQEQFLCLIKDKIAGSSNRWDILQKIFPKEEHRIFFINWARMIAHSDDFGFDEAEERDNMSFKDIKEYYQLSLFDLFK